MRNGCPAPQHGNRLPYRAARDMIRPVIRFVARVRLERQCMSIVDPISQPLSEYSLPPAPAESLVRLTVKQYHDMARQGIFSDDERVELLEGLLVRKTTVSPAHHLATARVQDVLRKYIPPGYFVASPASVTLATSEPEPDAMVVRGVSEDYAERAIRGTVTSCLLSR